MKFNNCFQKIENLSVLFIINYFFILLFSMIILLILLFVFSFPIIIFLNMENVLLRLPFPSEFNFIIIIFSIFWDCFFSLFISYFLTCLCLFFFIALKSLEFYVLYFIFFYDFCWKKFMKKL